MGHDVKYGISIRDAEAPRCAHLEPEPSAAWKTERPQKFYKEVLAPRFAGNFHGTIFRRLTLAVNPSVVSRAAELPRLAQPLDDFGGFDSRRHGIAVIRRSVVAGRARTRRPLSAWTA